MKFHDTFRPGTLSELLMVCSIIGLASGASLCLFAAPVVLTIWLLMQLPW